MRHHCEALKSAIEIGAVPAALTALVGIAETLIERDERERAAQILALVLCYPMHATTRDVAEELFNDLQAELCPRVILDAQTQAEEITLDDLACEVIGELAE